MTKNNDLQKQENLSGNSSNSNSNSTTNIDETTYTSDFIYEITSHTDIVETNKCYTVKLFGNVSDLVISAITHNLEEVNQKIEYEDEVPLTVKHSVVEDSIQCLSFKTCIFCPLINSSEIMSILDKYKSN